MRRRAFLASTLAATLPAALPTSAMTAAEAQASPAASPTVPQRIAGMTLRQLYDDCRDRLFNHYLPFWERGGYDRQLGGFMCELNDDGSVFSDEKFIWYQGRGIWVYSFLYNEFGKDPRALEIARKSRDFMVQHMYAQDGKWFEKVGRDGSLIEGVGKTIYGRLFAAAGLVEYYLAAGDPEDLDLAKRSTWAAVDAYDDPRYTDTHTAKYTTLEIPFEGLRSQGHSMVIVTTLSRLLAHVAEPALEKLQRQHVDRIVNNFWNPQYGIVNEYLRHDFSRMPGADAHMFAGHSLETLWMVMQEAVRTKDHLRFETAKNRIRRLLEMCWDYVFDGWGDGNFFVFGTTKHPQGSDFSVKTMWAQCEAMVACMLVLEYTGESWAKEWYERVRTFTLQVMPCAADGVWRQAVDRFGKDVKRVGLSTKRRDNFHQVRFLMLNLLSLQRMMERAPGQNTLEDAS